MYRVLSFCVFFCVCVGFFNAHIYAACHSKTGQSNLHGKNTTLAYSPVSVGELVDKITILRIKSERITDTEKLSNVLTELRSLEGVLLDLLPVDASLVSMCHSELEQLQSINEQLWEIEDAIRQKEAVGAFDDEFIALARAVYTTNDERAKVKRSLNALFNSALVEEKSYCSYQHPEAAQ